jgi:hypothetical protein
VDLSQFERWYNQAGTPIVEAKEVRRRDKNGGEWGKGDNGGKRREEERREGREGKRREMKRKEGERCQRNRDWREGKWWREEKEMG